MTWMATRSPDEIKAMQDYGAAMRALFRALQDLGRCNAVPWFR
jgi:hypothetical protein